MPMNLPTPTLNLAVFYAIADNLDQETAENIASAFPDLFKSAFEYGAAQPTAKSKTDKPGPAKTKAPSKPRERTSNLSPEEHVEAAKIVAWVATNGGNVSAKIPSALDGRSKSRVLAFLVAQGTLSAQGKARGTRYYPAGAGADESEAAE